MRVWQHHAADQPVLAMIAGHLRVPTVGGEPVTKPVQTRFSDIEKYRFERSLQVNVEPVTPIVLFGGQQGRNPVLVLDPC